MLLGSVFSEGLNGMQQSQRKMQQAAVDIVRAGVSTDRNELNVGATGSVPTTNNGTSVNDLSATSTVEATQPGLRSGGGGRRSGDIVEPLIETKRQQLLFDASAKIVSTANDTIGKLLDDLS